MCWECAKIAKNVTFWTKRKVTEKDGDLKICLPVGQTDQESVKNMDKLLSNWFGNWFRRKTPICAKNVPKWPKVLVLELKKKWKKRIAIWKLALQYFKLTAKIGRRRLNYSWNDLLTHSEKNPPICAGNVPKLPKMSLFEPREKSQKRMATSKFALQ